MHQSGRCVSLASGRQSTNPGRAEAFRRLYLDWIELSYDFRDVSI
jgi:hypothetical protein